MALRTGVQSPAGDGAGPKLELRFGYTMGSAAGPVAKRKERAMATGEKVGQVVHVFDKIMVAVVRLDKGIRQGDRLHFLGSHTDFDQPVTSMQVEHQPVEQAAAGTEVAVKLSQAARRGDAVYLLKE